MKYSDQLDYTYFTDPVLRERHRLGHHPRRPMREAVCTEPMGWYRAFGNDIYRAAEHLMYRIDVENGLYRVYKVDWRPHLEQYFRGYIGPELKTLIGAKALIEGDAAEMMKGQPA